jgi:hypothetical protein
MPQPETTRDLTGLTVRAFRIAPETLDEKRRRVRGIFASETPAPVLDLERWEVVDEVLLMSGARFAARVPLLDSHLRAGLEYVLGSGLELKVENAELAGWAEFSSAPEAERAFVKVREGHVTDFSVGYRVLGFVTVEPGTTASVNGKSYTAGERALRVTTAWEVKEVSLVAIGADPNARVRSGGSVPHGKESGMDPKAKEKEDAPRDQPVDATRSDPPAVTPPAAPSPAPAHEPSAAEQKAGVLAERQRQAEIRKLGQECGIDAALIERAVAEDFSLDQARAAYLDAVRVRTPAVPPARIEVRDGDQRRELLADGLLLRAAPHLLRDAKPERLEAVRGLGRLSLLDLCRKCCELEGIRPPAGEEALVARAMSTLSLPIITGALVNKAALAQIAEEPATSLQVAYVENDIPDFKENTRVRTGAASALAEVNEGGEVQVGEFGEWYGTFTLKTYARLFSLTRKMIYNDDLGQLLRMVSEYVASAIRTREDAFYTMLLANGNLKDGKALFGTGAGTHANISTGVFGETGIAAAELLLRKMKDGNKPLNIRPAILLVPPEHAVAARKLLADLTVTAATAGGPLSVGPNVYGGLKLVVEPRLSDASFTGYSVVKYYLLPAPASAPSLIVGFLRGMANPTIEEVPLAANLLGMQWRVVYDFAVGAVDYKLVQSTGA